MKICKNLTMLVLAALLLASCKTAPIAKEDKTAQPAGVEAQEDLGPYILGPADQIAVNVWRNTDLTRALTIDPAGNIDMPLVGEIKASGLTLPELQKKITSVLTKYIKNPQVDINTVSIKSARIYVLGEVKSPGSFMLDHKVQAIEAVAMAGGFTDDANQDNVLLVRRNNEQADVTSLGLDVQHPSGHNSSTSAQLLRNGDVIYVTTKKIADVEKFMVRMNNILDPIVNLEKGIIFSKEATDVISGKSSSGDSSVIIAH